jgi:hypothetical protein
MGKEFFYMRRSGLELDFESQAYIQYRDETDALKKAVTAYNDGHHLN